MRSNRADINGDDNVLVRAAELAGRLKEHVFDSRYHAVALERDAVLVNADERDFNSASGEGAIQRLQDFRPQTSAKI